MLRATLLLLAVFFCTSPALAAWGENWGEMVWGSSAPPAAVPMTRWPGLLLLLTVLLVTALWKMKRMPRQVGLTLSVFLLVPVLIAPHISTWTGTSWYTFINGEVADANEVNGNFEALADALDVTVQNSFANSGIADANEINSNFEALKTAVDTFTSNAAAATAATDTAFSNGVASVDITTDNAAAYASGVASVDITTNDHQVCEGAGGSWIDPMDGSPPFCLPADVRANDQSVCEAAGGTWDAGTSTCTAASTYNCFVAGFCAQAATDFPPHIYAYTNMYDGHNRDSEPALGAGCNEFPGSEEWLGGSSALVEGSYPPCYPAAVCFQLCQ